MAGNVVTGLKVPPCSRGNLRRFAAQVHSEFHYDGSQPFPIVEVIELALPQLVPGFSFEVLTEQEMGTDHGMSFPDRHVMRIREDVYYGAIDGKGRDRFTMCHEFAHQLIHEGLDIKLTRTEVPHKTFEDSEWQADALAGEILMPHHLIKNMTETEIVENFLVTPSAARTQLKVA